MARWVQNITVWITWMLLTACGEQVVQHRPGALQLPPQNLYAYVASETADVRLLSEARQQRLAEDYRCRFAAPWQAGWSGRSAEELFGNRQWLMENALYGGNRQPVPMPRRQRWLAQCAIETFPNADYPAITLRPSNLRGLPTRQPAFYAFSQPGEGFPFDYLQYSSIPASTPVRVRHRSADGCWVLVETEAMFGWLPAMDVAAVDTRLQQQYEAASWYVAVKDDVPLTDAAGNVLAVAGLGSLWAQPESGVVWVAVRGEDGRAKLRRANYHADSVRRFPVLCTPANMAIIGNRLLGKPYDWGDQFGERDCSSTLRDLFACFGLYLPRNSAAQAVVAQRLGLSEVAVTDRPQVIRSQAQPWLTLAYMPGHIMLYVGEFRDQPVFLHAMWGIKVEDRQGREGRYLVGKTVVTGLRVGEELIGIKRPGGLLQERIQQLVLLTTFGEADPVGEQRQ
ncbi:NLPC_P60 superfamily protein [Syntrophotalea carbinolica DSM 2380]|uniref:NLPC_P60 superfamily protein n=1 Tax=Syntrophotalea carbinolica (strain DSM 2380 / NBRC 103641 / GraBd1) TaxID=338963 RepID=Q3A1R0_SYNC1|nr:NlpC/P60 family N-terminal domain-containing protein [Syntrophotalea carbinolica]ABA89697.1 NLPC_P60 superfamily protein [Syntrophotalea carbinolica DSM 2380]